MCDCKKLIKHTVKIHCPLSKMILSLTIFCLLVTALAQPQWCINADPIGCCCITSSSDPICVFPNSVYYNYQASINNVSMATVQGKRWFGMMMQFLMQYNGESQYISFPVFSMPVNFYPGQNIWFGYLSSDMPINWSTDKDGYYPLNTVFFISQGSDFICSLNVSST